jgi:NADH-quinone oxidoreductase subunit N
MAGVVVSTRLGAQATVLYLAIYLAMNVAAFAVVVARERETGEGDHIEALAGLGSTRPVLAWPMTIAMLSLAGIPATAGFIGKFYLISATVNGGYTWLGVVIVIGSMISLGYYLRVVAAMWMREAPQAREPLAAGVAARPAMAGGSPEADELEGGLGSGAGSPPTAAGAPPDAAPVLPRQPEVVGLAVLFGAASVFFGIVPSPAFDLAREAGRALTGLF